MSTVVYAWGPFRLFVASTLMINILDNAVKFTNAPGDVTLTVEQLKEKEGRETLS